MKKKLKLSFIVLVGWIICFNPVISINGEEQNVPDNQSSDESSLVDIGGERKIYLKCKGRGSPTVVFVSGRSDRADIWQTIADKSTDKVSVYSAIAKLTHVCAYDRPGTVTIIKDNIYPSRSTSILQPITPKNTVADLHAVLKAAKVPEPYILVGHSYGGLIVRLYASTYPNEVAGLVLIDTLTEMLYDALDPAQQKLWIRLNSNYSPDLERYTIQERTDFIPSFEQVRNAPPIHSMPVVVLSSNEPYEFKSLIALGILPADTPIELGPIIFQAHLNGQRRLANLLHAKLIMQTHAGHYIHTE
jgi:pimeloyl-ACP methyl ester carboxylesterase